MGDMIRGLLLGVFIAWLVCAFPAYVLAGKWGLAGSAVAGAVCAFPAAVSLHFYRTAASRDAALWRLLGGIFFRIAFVLGAGTLLHASIESFDLFGFVLWLMLLYLVTLAIEVGFLVNSLTTSPKSVRGTGRP
jgi:hypothetical protein